MIGSAEIAPFPSLPDTVAFHRTELSVILGLYGRAIRHHGREPALAPDLSTV